MQTVAASLTGVVRTVLIIIALYFVVRVLSRLLSPLLYGNKSRPSSASEYNDRRREGDVRIEYPRKKKRKGKNGKDGGEYIDFEEVD